jgi:hypothetical protein
MKNGGPRLRHYPDVTLQPALRLDALHPSRLLRISPLEVVRVFGSGDGTGDDPVGRNGLAAWGERRIAGHGPQPGHPKRTARSDENPPARAQRVLVPPRLIETNDSPAR